MPTTPEELRGEVVFKAQCATCHYSQSSKPLHGPGLLGVFRKKYLPSGAPANDDRVRDVIRMGRSMMPAIHGLDEMQTSDLLAYLHTL